MVTVGITIPKPVGKITIHQDDKVLVDNLFTNYGLLQAYKSGKNTVLDTTNGGIFRYLHVGSSNSPITKSSTGLTTVSHTATRISSTLTFKTDPNTNIRYAEFSTLWRLPSGISSFQQIGMSDNVNGTLGLLCGRTLNGPIELNSGSTTDVTYLVQIPILSQIGTLESGIININGTDYNYSLEGTFHNETSTQLNSILPYITPQVISGNLSRMWVNNIILDDGKSSYQCSATTGIDQFSYTIISKIINYDPTITIVNINIGNSNPSNVLQSDFPIRIVFQQSPTKPIMDDMTFEFTILLKFLE